MKTILPLTIIFLAACSSISIQNKSSILNVGDSKEQIIKTMGPPENRQLKLSKEAWQYCETTFGLYHFLIVWIDDGKMSGINTYEDSARPFTMCSGAFRSIRWEDAPNLIIEKRER